MDLWAARGFRAIPFIYRLSIVCGPLSIPGVVTWTGNITLRWKASTTSPRDVVVVFLPRHMKECLTSPNYNWLCLLIAIPMVWQEAACTRDAWKHVPRIKTRMHHCSGLTLKWKTSAVATRCLYVMAELRVSLYEKILNSQWSLPAEDHEGFPFPSDMTHFNFRNLPPADKVPIKHTFPSLWLCYIMHLAEPTVLQPSKFNIAIFHKTSLSRQILQAVLGLDEVSRSTWHRDLQALGMSWNGGRGHWPWGQLSVVVVLIYWSRLCLLTLECSFISFLLISDGSYQWEETERNSRTTLLHSHTWFIIS